MQKTTTFLMFVGDQCGKAEQAVNDYVTLFDDSRVVSTEYFTAEEAGGRSDLVKMCTFVLAGQEYIANDSPMPHEFSFTPAVSIFVTCDSVAEIDSLYEKLSTGGQTLMPIGDYGFSQRFGWVNDKYGVSWQMSLPS